MGGGNNGNYSLVYIPPFLIVDCTRETAWQNCLSPSVRLAMKLVVAQFCRTKDHEIINEGTEGVRSGNTMQFWITTS